MFFEILFWSRAKPLPTGYARLFSQIKKIISNYYSKIDVLKSDFDDAISGAFRVGAVRSEKKKFVARHSIPARN